MWKRFYFERRRRGWFIETRWFFARIYPPTLPRWTIFVKR